MQERTIFDRRWVGGLSVMAVAGDVDISNATEFGRAVALAQAGGALAIDLCQCSYMDSTGLSVLIGAYKAGGRQRILLAVPRESFFRRLFKIAGVEDLFSIHERVQDMSSVGDGAVDQTG